MQNRSIGFTAEQRYNRVEVRHTTGPLSRLGNGTILVLADMENLIRGAQDLGLVLDPRLLGILLMGACRTGGLHAFFSRMPGDDRLSGAFTRAGWVAHPRDITFVQTPSGVRRRANSDNMTLLYAGHLAAQMDIETIVLGSGDGDLVSDAAHHLRELRPDRRVVTLSLAGSTSARLDCRVNRDIAFNMEIGLDCLRTPQGRRP